VISAYEQQRLSNIQRNNDQLKELGLVDQHGKSTTKFRRAERPKTLRTPRKRSAPQQIVSSRKSSRISGAPPPKPTLDDAALDALLGEKTRSFIEPLKRASDKPRLTAAQMAKLHSLEATSEGVVTDAEVSGLEGLREELVCGSWMDHQSKGTNMYAEKRAKLAALAAERGLRWPSWLGKIQGALPPMGRTETARHQTMLSIEQAACGLGFTYHAWPEGTGVLLADTEEVISARPRLLTLGSDTEALKREGQKLESRFARDTGNGWAYNHHLGKLRTYQEMLLMEHWGEEPSAPSIRELEAEEACAEEQSTPQLTEEKGQKTDAAEEKEKQQENVKVPEVASVSAGRAKKQTGKRCKSMAEVFSVRRPTRRAIEA